MMITVNGVSLFYEVTGVGLPLLLLHGNREGTVSTFDIVAEVKALSESLKGDQR